MPDFFWFSLGLFSKIPIDFKIECVYASNSPNNISKAEISKKPSFVKNVRLNTDQIQIIILDIF